MRLFAGLVGVEELILGTLSCQLLWGWADVADVHPSAIPVPSQLCSPTAAPELSGNWDVAVWRTGSPRAGFWKRPLSRELNVNVGIKDCLEGESLAAVLKC